MKKVRGVRVTIANGKKMVATGAADCAVTTRTGTKLEVGPTLYVPDCHKTLISVSQLAKQPDCARVEFDSTGVFYVTKRGARSLIGILDDGLYQV